KAEEIKKLATEGVDIFRINASHGNFEELRSLIILVAGGRKKIPGHIGILLDLRGPKIRCGEVTPGPVELKIGDILEITSQPVVGNAKRVSINYPDIIRQVKVGEK